MKNINYYLIVIGVSLLLYSCQNLTETDVTDNGGGGGPIGTTTLTGSIVDKVTGNPLDSATVTIIIDGQQYGTTTDIAGKFSAQLNITADKQITFIGRKSGYLPDTTVANVTAGRANTIPSLQLEPLSGGTVTGGLPGSITVVSQSAQSIFVKESGANETASVLFLVSDSSGFPLTISRRADVNFRFTVGPNGGEYINPLTAKTDENGMVRLYLSSGTIAGVVQIEASIISGVNVIKSNPVVIAIHGGAPVLSHFSLGADRYNFPGLDWIGRTNGISVLIGDKYSNPVRPNTAVYFNSTGGVIQGSALTDINGQGGVTLFSGLPEPLHPVFGPGFAIVTARTGNETNNEIAREIIILFSGYPSIDVSPTVIDVPNGGSQFFNYVVADRNGNPMSAGTTIKVSHDGEDVKLMGDIDITMDDVISKSATFFSFTLADEVDTVNVAKPISVTIETQGPNGIAKRTISGVNR